MRSYLIYVIAFLFTLSACNKESFQSNLSEDMIEFGFSGVQLDSESRSGEPVDELPDGSSFGVFGYCLAQTAPDNSTLVESSGALSWDVKKNLIKPTLFYQKEVRYSGGVCSYEDPVSWYKPVDYQYSFFAYYPYDKGFSMISDENTFGAPSIKFSMPVPDNSTEDTELTTIGIPDAMVAQEIDVTRGDGVVPLRFYHLLAGLNVQVNNYNKDPEDTSTGMSLTIHSIKFVGEFYKSIVINFDKGYDYPNETYKGKYTIVDSEVVIPAGTTVNKIGDKTLLLVSNITETGASNGYFGNNKIVIDYTFGGIRNQKEYTRMETFMPAGGTIYTLQLNFIGNAFVLNFVVDNSSQWEDGNDSEITFE